MEFNEDGSLKVPFENSEEKEYSSIIELIKDNLGNNKDSKSIELINKMKNVKERGYLTKEEFVNICMWKSPRPKKLYLNNPEEEIISVTKQVLSTDSEILKIKLLKNLKGIEIPTASAILTILDPDNYGVIDIRAWKLLYKYRVVRGNPEGNNFSLENWEEYLEKIRKFAKELNVPVRDVEITLFYYHKETQKGNLYSV